MFKALVSVSQDIVPHYPREVPVIDREYENVCNEVGARVYKYLLDDYVGPWCGYKVKVKKFTATEAKEWAMVVDPLTGSLLGFLPGEAQPVKEKVKKVMRTFVMGELEMGRWKLE